MTHSAVVWDMDGTLIDSAAVVPAAFAAALAHVCGRTATAAEVIAAYPLGTPEVILAHLAGRPLTGAEMEAYYLALQGAAVCAYPQIAQVLAALRARGYPVAVFTGASRRAAVILLASAGLDFDVLVSGDQVRRAKPAPDGLLLAGAELGVPASELAYVGDAPADLQAAKAAGSLAVAAAWGHLYSPAVAADVMLEAPMQALALLRDQRPRHPA